MNRKDFLRFLTVGGGIVASVTSLGYTFFEKNKLYVISDDIDNELSADLMNAGGELGGYAAVHSALINGLSVILTEETNWIGSQFTQQGIPPDEHRWIETHGAT